MVETNKYRRIPSAKTTNDPKVEVYCGSHGNRDGERDRKGTCAICDILSYNDEHPGGLAGYREVFADDTTNSANITKQRRDTIYMAKQRGGEIYMAKQKSGRNEVKEPPGMDVVEDSEGVHTWINEDGAICIGNECFTLNAEDKTVR